MSMQYGYGGNEGGDARGNADRHGEDVVDQERRSGRQGGQFTEVVLGHDIGAAAAGIGLYGLPVGHADDNQQGDDGQPDPEAVGENRDTSHQDGADEDSQNLFRGIG